MLIFLSFIFCGPHTPIIRTEPYNTLNTPVSQMESIIDMLYSKNKKENPEEQEN